MFHFVTPSKGGGRWFQHAQIFNKILRKNNRMKPRFLHSHRPHIKKASGPQLNSAGSILWSYIVAPSNLLFLTTNLLGLGIITTYRGLSTLANSDLSVELEVFETLPPHTSIKPDWDFKIRPDSFFKNPNNVVEEDVFQEGEIGQTDAFTTELDSVIFEEESSYVSEGVFLSDDVDLPVTEEELVEYGPSQSRHIQNERMHHLILSQLLQLYQFFALVGSIFGENNVSRLAVIADLPQNYKTGFLNTLLPIVGEEKYETFEEFFASVPHNEILKRINMLNSTGIKNQLFYKIEEDLNENFIENNHIITKSDFDFEKGFKKLINSYSKKKVLNLKFLSDSIDLISQTSISDLNFAKVLERLNVDEHNKNFQTLSQILCSTLAKSQTNYDEETFLQMLKSSAIISNKSLFELCLKELNMDAESTGKKHTNKQLNQDTDNSSLGENSTALNTYIEALKGLIKLNYEKSHLTKASKYLFSSINRSSLPDDNSENHVNQIVNEHTRDSQRQWEALPLKTYESILSIGEYLQNNSILEWCLTLMKKNKNVKEETLNITLNRLNEWSMSHENEKLAEIVQKFRHNDI